MGEINIKNTNTYHLEDITNINDLTLNKILKYEKTNEKSSRLVSVKSMGILKSVVEINISYFSLSIINMNECLKESNISSNKNLKFKLFFSSPNLKIGISLFDYSILEKTLIKNKNKKKKKKNAIIFISHVFNNNYSNYNVKLALRKI